MSFGDDIKGRNAEKSVGELVSEVSEKASLLVREEIELAKSEIQDKVSKLTKGTVVATLAGTILFFATFVFLIGLSFFFNDLFDYSAVWPGFLIVFLILVVLAVITGVLAYRWLRGGSPPTPELAIEEARVTREALEKTIERDQAERALEKGDELEKAAN
jgi:uncharacterized membrane protein YqjE